MTQVVSLRWSGFVTETISTLAGRLLRFAHSDTGGDIAMECFYDGRIFCWKTLLSKKGFLVATSVEIMAVGRIPTAIGVH